MNYDIHFSVHLSEKDQEVDTIDELDVHRNSPPSIERRELTQSVRIATVVVMNILKLTSQVDNFQGEEAKVIIVSLGRSNENGKVGFLKTSNRINVLLRCAPPMCSDIQSCPARNVYNWRRTLRIVSQNVERGY